MMECDRTRAAVALLAVAVVLSASAVPFIVTDGVDEADAIDMGKDWWLGKNPFQIVCCGLGMAHEEIAKILYKAGGENWEGLAAAGDSDAVKAFARKVACEHTAESLTVLANLASTLVDNENNTLPLTESYLARTAEISSATMWSPSASYDGSAVLEYGGIYAILANTLYNTQDGINYALDNIGDRVHIWKSKDVYSSISTRIVWDGGSTDAATSHANIVFTNIVEATQSRNLVFVPEMSPTNSDSGATVIWSLSGSARLAPADGGQAVELSKGRNEFAHGTVPSGWYRISQGTYGGILMPAMSSDSASVSGGAVIAVDNVVGGHAVERLGHVTCGNGAMTVDYLGTRYTTSTLGYRYSDGNGADYYSNTNSSSSDPDPIGNLVAKWASQMEAVGDLMYRASVAGQTMWGIAAAAGEANLLLSPSSISAQLTGIGIDAAQSYAMYVAALGQISQYYQTYGTQLRAGQTQISSQSLSLYCLGDVYDPSGRLVAGNAVFTPYVYINNMDVKKSATAYNTFDQDGTVMVWSDSCADLSQFDASDAETQTLVVMPKGAYFQIRDMVYKGEPAESVTLTVKTVEQTEGFSDILQSATEPPKVMEAQTLVMVIMIELAVIVALLGWALRMPLLFVIAALVGAVGILFQETVAQILLKVIGR